MLKFLSDIFIISSNWWGQGSSTVFLLNNAVPSGFIYAACLPIQLSSMVEMVG
jgi:hypothetical protein